MIKNKTEEYGYSTVYDGVAYQFRRASNKWELYSNEIFLGLFTQVKQAKEYILSLEDMAYADIPAAPLKDAGRGLWECLPPAGAMVLLLKEIGRAPSELERTTLDCYGFLDEEGNPDIDAANRHMKRLEKVEQIT